jgi:hypothetical protein
MPMGVIDLLNSISIWIDEFLDVVNPVDYPGPHCIPAFAPPSGLNEVGIFNSAEMHARTWGGIQKYNR